MPCIDDSVGCTLTWWAAFAIQSWWLIVLFAVACWLAPKLFRFALYPWREMRRLRRELDNRRDELSDLTVEKLERQ